MAKKNGQSFEKGDKVWSIIHGSGYISDINRGDFPIVVQFDNFRDTYTDDGFIYTHSRYRDLFHEEMVVITKSEYESLKRNGAKPSKKNGDPFEVGDEVWSILGKKGKIIYIIEEQPYPIAVDFFNEEVAYTLNGGLFTEDDSPSLFHQKPILTFED